MDKGGDGHGISLLVQPCDLRAHPLPVHHGKLPPPPRQQSVQPPVQLLHEESVADPGAVTRPDSAERLLPGVCRPRPSGGAAHLRCHIFKEEISRSEDGHVPEPLARETRRECKGTFPVISVHHAGHSHSPDSVRRPG